MRAHLLARGEIEERVLALSDLSRATGIWLINSVRGRQPAALQPL
jgi:para-aminobenzoate synthetase/4-amino-4-deoxychorismate lyase